MAGSGPDRAWSDCPFSPERNTWWTAPSKTLTQSRGQARGLMTRSNDASTSSPANLARG
jgi:hypothetical protein